ncbi:MAG TPA: HAMP domain-containing sensor histidine kinase [Gemmatimonadales bacterium]|nr:HAMP domain-containing sensor histidine kinase [Gemmatimonadales bacterium]
MEEILDAGEVLRQASAVIGQPVTLWEVTGEHEAVPRATSDQSRTPRFDLEATLRRWNIPIPIGSRWVAAPGATSDAWVIAPVRSRPPAPPPQGRERRSKERLALELAGLALGLIDAPASHETAALPSGMIAHEASNPLTAARAGLELAMESVGRWVDLAADRRLALLDDLGEVLEDLDRTSEFLRVVRDRARAGGRAERFDAVRVVRSCLTLERRLLRDRGIDLDFTTALEATYLKGDPNALFDLLVNLVRNAADATAQTPTRVRVQLDQRGRDLELVVRGSGTATSIAKLRGVAEGFSGTVRVDSGEGHGAGTTFTIVLPVPPQREGDSRRP